jgi:hypothetical protein
VKILLAMSTRQCERLLDAIGFAAGRRTQVLVLVGGAGFFSNGIHLHDIEAAANDPDDSAACSPASRFCGGVPQNLRYDSPLLRDTKSQ